MSYEVTVGTDNSISVSLTSNEYGVTLSQVGQQGSKGADWQGSWVTSTSYDANDTVENNGSSYICILAHTSASTNEPGVGVDTTTYWEIIAQKGADGTDGDGTLGTLTKSFVSGEASTIPLTQAITAGAPVVSVTKEVPQTGVSSSRWDVDTNGSNYDRHDTAYSTTLTPSNATGDGIFTLGVGSFASDDVGKTIEGNGGEATLAATDGSYRLVTSFNDVTAIASGNWSMYASVFDATNGLELSSISNGFNIAGASYDTVSFSVASQDSGPVGLAFNNDGTKMYIVGQQSDSVYQYTLSTAFDLSTASYDAVSFSVASQDGVPVGIAFSNDGTKMYVVGNTDELVFQYSLSTAFDLSTASYDAVSFSMSGQNAAPRDIAFKPDGTEMYMVGAVGASVYQYTLSTAFDLSTASYDTVSFSVAGQDAAPLGIAFNNDGTKMYMVGASSDSVFQYSTAAFIQPTAQYIPAITNAGGQIDSTYWTDINSMTTDQVTGDGQVYYAVSTDGRTTWKIIDNNNGERPIVRDNLGTWQYNSNATYGSITWTNATTNAELDAIKQALGVTANQMDQTQIETVTDANHYALANNLDLMIALYLGSSSSSIPSSDGVSINYDAQAKNEGAILGTDYDFDFPATDVVRVTSGVTANLKVRVV